MDADERGFRVALVADELVNPGPNGIDALAVLEQEGWGAIQLPPRWYPDDVSAQLLEQVAEHVEEFARHGYEIVLVGDHAGLAEALTKVGVELPESVHPETAAALRAFLHPRPRRTPAAGAR